MPSTSFYALSTLSVEKALPRFLEKLYNQGMICVLRTPTPERAAQWSQLLWTYGSGSFLPHGCAPESMEGQPIWITHGPERPEGAETLILVEGATEMDLSPYKRCSYFFDAQSARGVAEAFAYY
jgi:DNA polymerase-3 subunit chi